MLKLMSCQSSGPVADEILASEHQGSQSGAKSVVLAGKECLKSCFGAWMASTGRQKYSFGGCEQHVAIYVIYIYIY